MDYTPGKLIFLADTLSRAPLNSAVESEIKFDKMVHNLSVEALDEPKSIEKLRCATARDPVLCKVLEYNRSGWPSVKRLVEPQVAQYYSMRFELMSTMAVYTKAPE